MKGASRFFLFLIASVVCLSCSSRDIRPNFKNEGEILRRQWTYSFEPISSSLSPENVEYVSPVIYENTLLFGSDRFGVVSFYPKIERTHWKIQIPNGIVSQIEVHGDEAFFAGGDGNVYSIQLETGKTLWTYAIRNPVASRPTIEGDDLYIVTSDDALLSLENKTGKWQWHYRRTKCFWPRHSRRFKTNGHWRFSLGWICRRNFSECKSQGRKSSLGETAKLE